MNVLIVVHVLTTSVYESPNVTRFFIWLGRGPVHTTPVTEAASSAARGKRREETILLRTRSPPKVATTYANETE